MTFFYDLNQKLAGIAKNTQLNESAEKTNDHKEPKLIRDLRAKGLSDKEIRKELEKIKSGTSKHMPKESSMNEADMEEGNEFSGELAKAKAAGKKEFEVDGKTYPVKEGAKPDYIDLDKDGNRKETMKKAAADKKAAEKDLDEQWITEKWAGDTELNPEKAGMFKGKTKAELLKQLNKLRASGPHEKGSPSYTKMKQLQFAIRAKKGWKGGVDESEQLDELSPDTLKSYAKKAASSTANIAAKLGKQQADAEEVDRYTNRHFPKGVDQFGQREAMRKAMGADYSDINQTRGKAAKRVAGIGKAIDRLAKEDATDGIGDVMSPKDKAEKMKRARGGRDYYEGQEQPHDIPLKGKSSPGTDFDSVKADRKAKLTTKKGIVPEADVTGLGDSKHAEVEMENATPYQPNKNTPAPDYEKAVLEGVSRMHFKQVAELLRNIENEEKRAELAQHHADVFAQQNPRFDRNKFFAAVGLDNLAEGWAEMDAWLKQREKEQKGTGKFDKRKVSTGTVYTRKPETFDPDAEEKDLEGQVVKRGRGRPKKVSEHGSGVENVPGKSWQSSKAGAHPWNAESKEMEESHEVPVVDRGEYDREGDMAKDDLTTIKLAADELHSILRDEENLPEWLQSKITKAMDYIDTARDYMISQHSQGQQEIAEKAVSQAQRKAAGIAYAAKKGDIPKSELRGASKEMAKMATGELKKFAKTKEKDLPAKVATKKVKEEENTVGDKSSESKPGKSTKGVQFGKGVYEDLNSKVESLIAEGMNISVNMSVDAEGKPSKNINVSADGADADRLAEILKMAGIASQEAPCDACGATPCGCDAQELEEADVTVDENNPDWPTNQETSDDPFQYSGGLNKPKSTGQTTIDRGIPSLDPRRQVAMEESKPQRSLFDLYKAIENK